MRDDMIGEKYGRWTVLYPTENTRKVHCRCECGYEADVYKTNLKRGISRSCGCYKVEKAIQEVKDCKDGDDLSKIKSAVENLEAQAMEIGKLVYQNNGGANANNSNTSSSSNEGTTDGAPEGAKEAN